MPCLRIFPVASISKVLLVKSSTVALPTRVSVASGMVIVFTVVNIVAMTPITPLAFPSTSKRSSLVASLVPSTILRLSGKGGPPRSYVIPFILPLS